MAADLTAFPVSTIKVTEMASDSTPSNSDIVMVVDSADGTSKQTTVGNIVSLASGGSSSAAGTTTVSPAVNGQTDVQGSLEDLDTRVAGLAAGGSDGVISDVALTGDEIAFTGTGGGFNGSVDISTTTAVAANTAKNSYPVADSAKVANLPADQGAVDTAQDAAIALNTAKTGITAAEQDKLGNITVTQTVDLDALEQDVSDHQSALGIAVGDTDLGTFTGSIIADNETVKGSIQDLEDNSVKNDYNSSVDPDVTFDSAAGWSVGSTIVNGSKIWEARDVSAGAAVWVDVTVVGGGAKFVDVVVRGVYLNEQALFTTPGETLFTRLGTSVYGLDVGASNQLYKRNATTFAIEVGPVTIPNTPIGITNDGTNIWVMDNLKNMVEIDPNTLTPTGNSFVLTIDFPERIAHDGTDFISINQTADNIFTFDATGTTTSSTPFAVGSTTHIIGFDSGLNAFVVKNGSSITFIEKVTGASLGGAVVGNTTTQSAYNESGRTVITVIGTEVRRANLELYQSLLDNDGSGAFAGLSTGNKFSAARDASGNLFIYTVAQNSSDPNVVFITGVRNDTVSGDYTIII